MPTEAFGLLYLLQSCHVRGADPVTVPVLCNHCVPVNYELVDVFLSIKGVLFTTSSHPFVSHGANRSRSWPSGIWKGIHQAMPTFSENLS